MARVENYPRKDMRNIIREHERDLKNYKNNVNKSLSEQNYIYGCHGVNEVMDRINNRVQEIMGDKPIQKQTNVVSEWSVFCPVELIAGNQEKEFFDTVWSFCKERYGEDNLITGYVHNDEKTPHMHIMFVPEAISRKTGQRTVSSASLLTRKELSQFHTDLDERCERVFGVKGLVRNGKTVFESDIKADELKAISKAVGKRYRDEISQYKGFIKAKGLEKEFSEFSHPKPKQAITSDLFKPQSVVRPLEAPVRPLEAPVRAFKPVNGKQPVKRSEEPVRAPEGSQRRSYTQLKREALERARQMQADEIVPGKDESNTDFSL